MNALRVCLFFSVAVLRAGATDEPAAAAPPRALIAEAELPEAAASGGKPDREAAGRDLKIRGGWGSWKSSSSRKSWKSSSTRKSWKKSTDHPTVRPDRRCVVDLCTECVVGWAAAEAACTEDQTVIEGASTADEVVAETASTADEAVAETASTADEVVAETASTADEAVAEGASTADEVVAGAASTAEEVLA